MLQSLAELGVEPRSPDAPLISLTLSPCCLWELKAASPLHHARCRVTGTQSHFVFKVPAHLELPLPCGRMGSYAPASLVLTFSALSCWLDPQLGPKGWTGATQGGFSMAQSTTPSSTPVSLVGDASSSRASGPMGPKTSRRTGSMRSASPPP